MKSMDLIIYCFTLLSAVIFGLCEAQWRIDDFWMKYAPPLSQHEIEAKVDKSLLVHGKGLRESMQLFQSLIQEYHDGEVYSEKNYDDIQKKISEFQEKLKTVNNIPLQMELEFKFQHELLDFLKNLQPSSYHYDTAMSVLESKLRREEEKYKVYIEDLQFRKQASLSDSERGISAKSRIEVHKPDVSIRFNVPLGKTVVIIRNADQEQEESDAITFSVENNNRSVFEFQLGSPEGTFFPYNLNGTYKQGKLLPGTAVQCYDDDEALRQPRYQIIVDDSSTMKTAVYYNPDGTRREMHHTIDYLKNDVFKQRNYMFKYSNGIPFLTNSSEYSFNLEDPQKQVVLTNLCWGSLHIKKHVGNRAITKKRLICANK